ncbi:hypothetical protein RAA17_20270 [Komagataeibacter rhaeticus]|nr:hypothetical protein [Komagataeibacter rhaeticus]
MPLDDSYLDLLRSDIADFKNIGSRPGGSITAANPLNASWRACRGRIWTLRAPHSCPSPRHMRPRGNRLWCAAAQPSGGRV